MIHNPIVTVTCDKCGYEEEHSLTVTARGWDDRGLEASLVAQGWTVESDGTITYCPDCTEEQSHE